MEIVAAFTAACLALIVFAYFGYPLVITAVALVRRRPVLTGDLTPSVTLITAAHNEEAVIARKIENSLALQYPRDRLQILLVSDGSVDRTAEIARRYTDRGVTVIELPRRGGKGNALNHAVAQASGEIVVISDAHAFCRPDALRSLATQFNDPTVGCVTGRKIVGTLNSGIALSEGVYWKYEAFIRRKESEIGSTTGLVGGIIAVRRALFRPIPVHIINDDVHLGMQVLRDGYRVVYDPGTVFWQMSTVSMRAESVRRRRMSAGRFQLLFDPSQWPRNNPFVLFQLFAHKFLRLLLPFLMVGAFGGNVVLMSDAGAPPVFQLALVAQAVFYLLAMLGWAAERRGWSLRAPHVAYFIAVGNLTALEGLVYYLSGKQTVLWEKAQRGTVS